MIERHAAERLPDLVTRQHTAMQPDQWWAASHTYVAPRAGFVSVAVVIDEDARRAVGRRIAR